MVSLSANTRVVLYGGIPSLVTNMYGWNTDKAINSGVYTRLLAYISSLQTGIKTVNDFYNTISQSYITQFAYYSNAKSAVIPIVLYGIILFFFGMAFVFEIIFYKSRTSKWLRLVVNFLWIVGAPGVILFSLFLNIIVPIIGSMSELAIIMEPINYNKTFYNKLEYPNAALKSLLYPCMFGEGDLHMISNNMGSPLFEISQLYNSLYALSMSTSGLSVVGL